MFVTIYKYNEITLIIKGFFETGGPCPSWLGMALTVFYLNREDPSGASPWRRSDGIGG